MNKKILSLLLAGSCLLLQADEPKIDPETGLKIAKGFEEVKNNCTICHSANFIVQSKNTKEEWLATIRWMQATQGLWEFDPQTEETILNYLAVNYPQSNTSRRRPQLKPKYLPKP
ncbi:hypothetical protein BBW65_02355 [Helicobacter enhydrae]|uniref:Cytochrome C n=1 Tax=Helicobacter enhydrae TaxID=222136 RepID=A0A1B1U4K2_9HELI|nr:hypothetical protein [Helicobacter enhydrae]ANV97717.1 hypothetical protein BBW65_02355 [Helicobacter enhydrae]